uniref:Nudix hydrolase domain-containing protein n=1 Tax=Noctiluca scintillans TaxID=2966 RepID=A0A7S1EW64_NOCSC
MISLEHARRHQLAILSHKHVEELRQEIVSQQSTVLLNKEGILERVAAVTTLCITRSDGRMLVQVGKWKGNHLVPACQLPGGKPEQDETPQDTLDRLIETKLEFLIDCLSVQECIREVEWKDSSRFHMRTKYIKTICNASVDKPFKAPVFRADSVDMDDLGSLPSSLLYAADKQEKTTVMHDLVNSDVLVMNSNSGSGSKFAVYMWATQSELEMMQRPESENFVAAWLNSLNFARRPTETNQMPDGTTSRRSWTSQTLDGPRPRESWASRFSRHSQEPRHSASSWLTKPFRRSTQRSFEASSVMESEVPSQSAVDSEVPSSTTEPTKTSLQDADVQSHEEAFLASSSASTVSAYQTL